MRKPSFDRLLTGAALTLLIATPLPGVAAPERVEQVRPMANIAPDPLTAFEIDPMHMWKERVELRGVGLDVVGFYHSHPRTEAVPSTYDRARAYYPESVYVIVGCEPEWEVRAFSIVGEEVTEIAVIEDVK